MTGGSVMQGAKASPWTKMNKKSQQYTANPFVADAGEHQASEIVSTASYAEAKERLTAGSSVDEKHTVTRVTDSVQIYTLSILKEPTKIRMHGFRRSLWREVCFHLISCFFSFGFLYLLERWWPMWKCRWRMRAAPFSFADVVLIENLSDNQVEIIQVSGNGKQQLKSFTYRYVKFFIKSQPQLGNHHTSQGTEIFSVRDIDPFSGEEAESFLSASMVSAETLERNKFYFGPNLIDLKETSYLKLFFDELVHPFNVFQLASIIIWLCEDYYIYSLTIFLISIIAIAITLYETKSNSEKMRKLARFQCPVRVLLKDGHDGDGGSSGPKWTKMDSSELTPGHVIALDSTLSQCPADLILIRGDAIVDESMLTGESVPVSKNSLHVHQSDVGDFNISELPSTSVIFAGTKVLRARDGRDRPAFGVVIRTGFETEKGQLVQSILFPRPISFSFYSDSLKYIAILGGIAAFGFFLSLWMQIRQSASPYNVLFRALDLITVVVPPALPATMSIGTVFSLSRLKSKFIHCISPSKINVASGIDLFCFDKTGTLTEEGLDLYGVFPAGDFENNIAYACENERNGEEEEEDCRSFSSSRIFSCAEFEAALSGCDYRIRKCMAMCHSLQKIDEILVGDPIDVRMFENSRWILEENHNSLLRAIVRPPGTVPFEVQGALDGRQECGIIRCFDFSSELRRMSVISKQLSSLQESSVAYCKGSPESIMAICRTPTIPSDFQAKLQDLTRQGYRVIACAQREMGSLTWMQVQKLARDQVEVEMTFLGFLIFENKIKKSSPRAIKQLTSARIDTVMITGDNILTSICVARSCGIIRPSERVFLPQQSQFGCSFVDCDDGSELISFENILLQGQEVVFACTGSFMEQIMNQPLEESKINPVLVSAFLKRCRVFSRMSPEDKRSLVSLFQKEGLKVGFCGDGANDCGALKAADIGISLSDSEASVAAPFCSACKSVEVVVEVLLEGRASLATSFACFKFMALYSMIQFTTLLLLYSMGSFLGDNQFVIIDLFLILPLGMLMGRFPPSTRLSPQPPDAKLISPSVLTSLLTQILLQGIAQLSLFLHVPNSSPFGQPVGSDHVNGPENAALFILSIFLYIEVALLCSPWRPYRSFYSPFFMYALACFLFGIILAALAWGSSYGNGHPMTSALFWLFELFPLSSSTIWIIGALVLGYPFASLILESLIASSRLLSIKSFCN